VRLETGFPCPDGVQLPIALRQESICPPLLPRRNAGVGRADGPLSSQTLRELTLPNRSLHRAIRWGTQRGVRRAVVPKTGHGFAGRRELLVIRRTVLTARRTTGGDWRGSGREQFAARSGRKVV